MNTTNKSRYTKLLQRILSTLEENSESAFLNYFQGKYVSREQQWAAWGRLDAPFATSMAAEQWHRKLKDTELGNKKNGRADFLIDVLIKYPDKYAAHLLSHEMRFSTVTKRQDMTHRNHKDAIDVPCDAEVLEPCCVWMVSGKGGRVQVEKAFECKCKVNFTIVFILFHYGVVSF